MLIDAYLRHYDLVERHRIVVSASRDATYGALRDTDWLRALASAARSVAEMRDVPTAVMQIVRRALRISPVATFTLDTALARGFALLAERRGRAVAIGAIGKLWKQDVALVPFEPAEFRDFREPKYAKLAVAMWVEPVGRDKAAVRFEARALATDDSARAHLKRWYRLVRPYTAVFITRALANIQADAEAGALVAQGE